MINSTRLEPENIAMYYKQTAFTPSHLPVIAGVPQVRGSEGFLIFNIMSKQTYYEKLRSPQWQKKRLEIMQRDEFTCQQCFDKDTTLNVHHKNYTKGAEPWEYEDDNFITLCECCHKVNHETMDEIKRRIFYPPIAEVFCEVLNNQFFEEYCVASLMYFQQYQNEERRGMHLSRMRECLAYYNEAKLAGKI